MSKLKDIGRCVVKDLIKYREDNKLTIPKMAKVVGCTPGSMRGWLRGSTHLNARSIQRCVDVGITNAILPKVREKRIIESKLESIDKSNKLKRSYIKRYPVLPYLIRNRMVELIDTYIQQLNEPKTYQGFKQKTDELISALYHLSRQGE